MDKLVSHVYYHVSLLDGSRILPTKERLISHTFIISYMYIFIVFVYIYKYICVLLYSCNVVYISRLWKMWDILWPDMLCGCLTLLVFMHLPDQDPKQIWVTRVSSFRLPHSQLLWMLCSLSRIPWTKKSFLTPLL